MREIQTLRAYHWAGHHHAPSHSGPISSRPSLRGSRSFTPPRDFRSAGGRSDFSKSRGRSHGLPPPKRSPRSHGAEVTDALPPPKRSRPNKVRSHRSRRSHEKCYTAHCYKFGSRGGGTPPSPLCTEGEGSLTSRTPSSRPGAVHLLARGGGLHVSVRSIAPDPQGWGRSVRRPPAPTPVRVVSVRVEPEGP